MKTRLNPNAFRLEPPTKWITIQLLWIGILGCALHAGAAEKPFVQDRFVIGLWVPPQVKSGLEARYKEIAEANFTLVVGSSGTNVTQQLEHCEKFGLKALVEAREPYDKAPDNGACWGYLLRDEPSTSDFPVLARQAEAVRRAKPGKFGYVNLFPNYASAAQLGVASYEEHVSRFIQEVKPEVLSMDHYPLMRPDKDTRAAYRENLEVFRRLSLQAGIPFWNYFYSMPFGDRMDPTEAQIRWQIHTSIAYGAKGVLYFCYWTPGKGNGGTGEFPKGGALLTAEGIKTRHYEEARRINAELRNLGPTLMKLTSTGVARINTSQQEQAGLSGGPVQRIEGIKGDPASEILVGMFRHADGRQAVVLVNDSYAHTAWTTVTFTAKKDSILEVDKATGEERKVVDDSPELSGLQLGLGAGDARLFLLPAAAPAP